jgi:tRNA(fMet)-specific endonuclease VapC
MYMLDTDTVSFALRGVSNVGAALLQRSPSELWISSITLAELRYGAERRQSRKLHGLIDTFTRTVRVAPFDEAAAMRSAKSEQRLPRAAFQSDKWTR